MSQAVWMALNKFKPTAEEMVGKFAEAAEAAGKVLVSAMSERAPKRTGALSRGIVIESEKTESGISVKVGPGTSVFYGRWVELGVQSGPRARPAQPFMRPAMDESRGQILAAVKKVLKK